MLPSLSRPSFGHAGTKGPLLPCILSAPLASLFTGKDATASTPISATGSPLPDLTSLPLSSSAGPEHPPTSEKLLEVWLTSPTTGATRHRRRAPVRSATTSMSCSDALPPAFSCLAGAWGNHDVVGEHLLISRPLVTHCRPRHGSALCTLCQMSSEPRALPCTLQPPSGRCARPDLASSWAAQAGHRSPPGRL
jgi:hypothetical protein